MWHRAFWAALGAILVLSVASQLLMLDSFRRGFDEGVHLLWARLLVQGYEPYSEVFIGYPPLFPEGLALAWRLIPSVQGVRVAMAAWNSLGLLAAALVAKEVSGHKAGIGAALLLALTPYHIFYSQAILADLPAISLATFAIWLGMRYALSGRVSWLLMAGTTFGASLLIKPLFPFGALVLGVLVLERYLGGCLTKLQLGRLVGLLAVSVMIPWLIAFLVYNSAMLYEQAIAFRMAAREGYSLNLPDRLRLMWSLVLDTPGLILLAGYGLLRSSKLSWLRRGMAAWLGTALLTVLYLYPLRANHLSVLLPQLAWLGGMGVSGLVEQLSGRPKRWQAIVAAGALAIYLVTLPFSLTTLQDQLRPAGEASGGRNMINVIQYMTSPEDCIISEDPWIVIDAGLSVPPRLAETSETRIGSGYLTWTELVTIAQREDCPAVVVSDSRENFQVYLPEFLDWVRVHYLIHLVYPHDEVYLVKRGVHFPPGLAAANIDGRIWLYNAGLSETILKAGQPVPIRLLWEVESPVSKDYQIFVHLRNNQNETVAQADHQPFAGLLPTSAWPIGEVIVETFWLSVPTDLPDGTYRLMVGLYDAETGERLLVGDDTSGENAVILGTLDLVSS